MRISFLVMNVTAMGGTVRSVVNLANWLSERHDVEIVSVYNTRAQPFFAVSPGVRVQVLDDRVSEERPHDESWWVRRNELSQQPSRLVSDKDNAYHTFNAWTDLLVVDWLRGARPDVLLGTRASLNLLVAEHARRDVVRVGQEHVALVAHQGGLYDDIAAGYPRLDGLVALTPTDAAGYRKILTGRRTAVLQIPNGLPTQRRVQSDLRNPVLLAAGRLAPVKGYDRLLRAFAIVADECPDWTLRLYGSGPQAAALRALITDLRLWDRVLMMGRSDRLDDELAKASVVAVTSYSEGFGMTIIEAMSHGVPVVSFDCPDGPREIIAPGEDGVLVANGDVDEFATALLDLFGNVQLRERLGQQALRSASRYDMAVVGRTWERELEQLHLRAVRV